MKASFSRSITTDASGFGSWNLRFLANCFAAFSFSWISAPRPSRFAFFLSGRLGHKERKDHNVASTNNG